MKKIIAIILIFQMISTNVFAYNDKNSISEKQLVEIYSIAIDSIVSSYDDMEYVDYIAIDMSSNVFKDICKEGKQKILKYFKKYGIEAINDSFDTLRQKQLVNRHGELEYIDVKGIIIKGILVNIRNVKIESDNKVVFEGYWYTSPSASKGFRSTIIYKNGRWQLDERKVIWIS